MSAPWHDGTSLDDQLVAAWYRLKAERQRNAKLVIALSWLRHYPAAWLRVVSQDTDAASIAVQQKWHIGPPPAPTAAEIAHVEDASRRAREAIANSNVVPPLRAAASTIRSDARYGPPDA